MTSVTTDRRFGLTSGVAIKAPADLATTANITLSGEQSIDGTTTNESRVFVKNQTTTSANGIYRSDDGAWTREPDFNGNRDVVPGTIITVFGGSTLTDTMWRVTNTGTITIGTTGLTFERAIVNDSASVSFLQAGTGAVTKTSQNKMRDAIDIMDFGADGTGATDDGPEFQNAATAAAGSVLHMKEGTYKLSTASTLQANTTIQGEGAGTLIKADATDFISASSKDNIVFRDIKFQMQGVTGQRMLFTLCNNIKFINCIFDGRTTAAAALTAQQVWLMGCLGAIFENCYFYDFNNAIYLDKSGAVNSDRVLVTGCHFEHLTHGNFFSYPTGVYQYFCDNVMVQNCTFKNILAGGVDPGFQGYSVYEGDGAAVSTKVVNCKSVVTEASVNHTFVLNTYATDTLVSGNSMTSHASNAGTFFTNGGPAANIVIANNPYVQGVVQIGNATAVTSAIVAGNNFSDIVGRGTSGAAVRIGFSTSGVNRAEISGNHINKVDSGGIYINVCEHWAEVHDNRIFDVNVLNTAYSAGVNEFAVAGISFYGPIRGRVSRNHVVNTNGGTGHAKHGINHSVVATGHAVDIRDDNTLVRMETAAVLNGFTSAARPALPWFPPGAYMAYMPPAAGAPSGEYCVDQRFTTVNGAEAGGQTVITVVNATGMATLDKVAILLDSGAYHYTSINGAPAGNDVTILAALPSASTNKEFVTARYRQSGNIA